MNFGESKANRDLCPTRARFVRNCSMIKYKNSDRVDIINFTNNIKLSVNVTKFKTNE